VIFTLKHKCQLHRFCRRGLEGVQADLFSKIFAYNLWRTAYVRHLKLEEKARPKAS